MKKALLLLSILAIFAVAQKKHNISAGYSYTMGTENASFESSDHIGFSSFNNQGGITFVYDKYMNDYSCFSLGAGLETSFNTASKNMYEVNQAGDTTLLFGYDNFRMSVSFRVGFHPIALVNKESKLDIYLILDLMNLGFAMENSEHMEKTTDLTYDILRMPIGVRWYAFKNVGFWVELTPKLISQETYGDIGTFSGGMTLQF